MLNQVKPTFEQVLEENKARIYRICKVYAAAPIEPEDLFQEVTYHLWKAFPSFRNKAKISTWVYRITLNVCIRYNSRLNKTNQNTIHLTSIKFEISDSPTNKLQEEKYQALNSCIQSLNQPDQTIVILSLEGLAYREIANITGLKENHIAVKMKRIKKALLICISNKLK